MNSTTEGRTMTTYRITSGAGVDMGTYEADSADGALDAMARDAGYASQADAVSRGVEPFTGTVREVTGFWSVDVRWRRNSSYWNATEGGLTREEAEQSARSLADVMAKDPTDEHDVSIAEWGDGPAPVQRVVVRDAGRIMDGRKVEA